MNSTISSTKQLTKVLDRTNSIDMVILWLRSVTQTIVLRRNLSVLYVNGRRG